MKYRYQAVKTAVIISYACWPQAYAAAVMDDRADGNPENCRVLSGPGDTEMSRGEEMPEEKAGRMIRGSGEASETSEVLQTDPVSESTTARSATYISVGKSFAGRL